MNESTTPKSSASNEINAYFESVPSPQRETLAALRATIRSILPHAEEAIKYGMPAFTLGGKGVAGYASFKDHCGYFPMSGSVLEQAGDLVPKYEVSKGGIRFGVDERLPIGLIRRLLKLRLAELGAVAKGQRDEYYDDGRLKATGKMKDGKLHGKWKWYRADGTLKRTGEFRDGEQSGVWTTWKPDGSEAKTTRFP